MASLATETSTSVAAEPGNSLSLGEKACDKEVVMAAVAQDGIAAQGKTKSDSVFNNQVFDALKHQLNMTKEEHAAVDYQKASIYPIKTTPPYSLFESWSFKKIILQLIQHHEAAGVEYPIKDVPLHCSQQQTPFFDQQYYEMVERGDSTAMIDLIKKVVSLFDSTCPPVATFECLVDGQTALNVLKEGWSWCLYEMEFDSCLYNKDIKSIRGFINAAMPAADFSPEHVGSIYPSDGEFVVVQYHDGSMYYGSINDQYTKSGFGVMVSVEGDSTCGFWESDDGLGAYCTKCGYVGSHNYKEQSCSGQYSFCVRQCGDWERHCMDCNGHGQSTFT